MHTFAQQPKATQPTKPAASAKTNPIRSGQRDDIHSFLQLQCTIGNHTTPSLLRTDPESLEVEPSITAASRFGHDFSQIPVHPTAPIQLQAKLTVNTPGDIYEQKADRVSEQVMRMP